MKKLTNLLLSCLIFTACTTPQTASNSAAADLDYCNQQVHRTLAQLHAQGNIDYTQMPRNIAAGDTLWQCRKASQQEWCGGFWPGILWYDYEYTHDSTILAAAEKFTQSLAFLAQLPPYDHDLGFLMFTSFGNGYRLTHKPEYKEAILNTAQNYKALFNPQVGTFLSWPRNVALFGGHNTIMDNMINLEMLFWAANESGDSTLRQMAISHADTTMRYHFRPDYTSYHVAVYDTLTGRFLKGVTHQGYADNSMWARGQAWAIYGYTVCYRFTHNPAYLNFVQHVADVYLQRLPADAIPYWDFDAPDIPAAPRDASAAAVVASALLELSEYLPAAKADEYKAQAQRMLTSLASPSYRSGKTNPAFLLHSTGHKPAGTEIDASIIYADYYYLEALLRANKLTE